MQRKQAVTLFLIPLVVGGQGLSLFNLINLGGDQCPSPRPPAHGIVAVPAKPLVGATAVYTCDPGYRIAGQAILTCLKGFMWSGFHPKCVDNYCKTPKTPDHGKVTVASDRTLVGGVATFICDPGFILEGPAVTICKDGQYWDRQPPACRRNSCWKPPNPDNGYSVSGNPVPVGGVASFACNPGYILKGSAVMTCDRPGHWNNYLPSCEKLGTANDMPELTGEGDGLMHSPAQVENGDTMGPAEETVVSIDKHNVRVPVPNVPKAERQDESEVGSREIIVESIEQPKPRNPGLSEHDIRAPQLDPRLRKSSVAVLSSIGNQVECLKLQPPENGRLKVSSSFPDGEASFECNPGFRMVGYGRRVCQADGIWTGTAPVCKPL